MPIRKSKKLINVSEKNSLGFKIGISTISVLIRAFAE